MFKFAVTALCLAIGLLAGCAPSPTSEPTIVPVEQATRAPQQRPTAGETPLSKPTAVETTTGRDLPLAPDVLAIYRKSGGFAGLDETLTVYQGGLIELSSRTTTENKSIKLDEPMLQPLRRMLESQEFADLEPLYRAVGADLITYSISSRDRNGNMKTVVTMDGATYPDFLGQLIQMFEQLRELV